ncbi:MAG: alanine racemase [Spirochaeta sp.]
MRPTRAVVHLNAIQHNLRRIRTQFSDPQSSMPLICAAVKANAYGHGAASVAAAALANGADMLGVAVPEEGIELREAGIAGQILLFSPFFPDEAGIIVQHDLVPMVFDEERIQAIAQAAEQQNREAAVFLKTDTGMGRVGCDPRHVLGLAQQIAGSRMVRLAGCATHFAASDAADTGFAEQQLTSFLAAAGNIRAHGISPGILSAANSGAVITMPRTAGLGMARPGIMMYGYYPSREVPRNLDLVPAMTFESAVSFIKTVPKGTPISYGMTYRTRSNTRIATIPVGYADGVFRMLSNRGRIWIRGRTYPIVGRICMDQLMIDIGTDSDVQLYDRAVLFGPPQPAPESGIQWPEQPPSAEEVADLCGTIPYEITCAVSSRIPRIFEDTPVCEPQISPLPSAPPA